MKQTKEIPLDAISLHTDFARTGYFTDEYNEMVTSIRQVGILYPLITIETGEKYLLVAGYRRYQAAKELGLPTVPCYVLKVGMDDAEIMRLHENIFREDISPLQEAQSYSRLEHTYHYTRDKISKLIGKSKSYVTQRIAILTWPQCLQDALLNNSLSYSVGRELSIVTDEKQLQYLLNLCITSGATVRTVLQWVKEWKEQMAERNLISSQQDQQLTDQSSDSSIVPCFFCGSTPVDGITKHVTICSSCYDQFYNDYIKPTDATTPTPPQ
jgi:ParB family chromosome partitioning protein